MEKTRIAVVSSDGVAVDEHFGKADHFLIFDVDETLRLVEKRTIEPLSVGDPNHPFDTQKFDRISSRLKDCSKVYMTRIGETPAAKLKAMNIEPVIYTGAIADIIG